MKLLRNVKTGAVFPFHAQLARNKDMEPYESGQEDVIHEIGGSSASSSQGIIIDKASKPELIKFAADNYGEDIDRNLSLTAIRSTVRALIEGEE